jgi:endonuclease YncB( thermonuclease family)
MNIYTIFMLLILFAASAPAQTRIQATCLEGKPLGVIDGDTFTFIDKNQSKFTIRLQGIDAPEISQPYGREAKNELQRLLETTPKITVCGEKYDKYDRLVAHVSTSTLNLNYIMISNGLAWFYKEFENELSEKDRKLYAAAEELARSYKLGLWSSPNPTPPWAYKNTLPSLTQSENPANPTKPRQTVKNTIEQSPRQPLTGRTYITGPRGDCYYINASGRKQYVDRSLCQ